jgi:hypothetical protein
MTMPRKLFRVTFTDTRFMRIELEAASPGRAINKAERLYLDGDPEDGRFVSFGGDAFADPTVDEVTS